MSTHPPLPGHPNVTPTRGRRRSLQRWISGCCLSLLAGPLAAAPDFVHEVAPILRENCLKCHTEEKRRAGLSFNTEASFREGSENGPVIDLAHPEKSLILELITTEDEDLRMPPKGDPLTEPQVAILRDWLAAGAPWEPGFSFTQPSYEPPLQPRKPELPPARPGRQNPIDRIIDHSFAQRRQEPPAALDDATFLRRVHLDLTGLLPTPEVLTAFLHNPSPRKREEMVDALLADDVAYAEHWLTFWNDLLRNDYAGTGYIDGGRKQITDWLYQSQLTNKPYDEFVRELVNPSAASEGFARGIQWRGSVSAAQTTPMQYAQSIGQTFLALNLKCASCHDSFVDRWKLSEAYGLAAVYADGPLEMFRCDQPTGKTAQASWLFPELGQIDPQAPQSERLRQLAELMTHPQNGRLTRAVTNRLWHRLMGRGIVHPVDAFQSEPWNADLLDYLGVHLAENHYDLKATLRLICLSQAYQSKAESFEETPNESQYVYQGPRPKRLTAEEFTDAIWQICGTAPRTFDAPVQRPAQGKGPDLQQQPAWIWSDHDPALPGQQLTLRKRFRLSSPPDAAEIALSADNAFELYVNGTRAAAGSDWQQPVTASIAPLLRNGENELLLVVTNGGETPNPAAALVHLCLKRGDRWAELVSDASWECTGSVPEEAARFRTPPQWEPCVAFSEIHWGALHRDLPRQLAESSTPGRMVRASLLQSDPLMRTLGRPNREQIVSSRPNELSTLEAMDLNNGQILDQRLAQGADALLARGFGSSSALATYLWRSSLSRDPSDEELELALAQLGEQPDRQSVQDLLWSLVMLPEFQIIR